MFCPKCRTEYREGYSKCVDCSIDLIDELPEEPEPEFIEYEEVMGTYNPADVAFIKSLLDSENITYYFNAESFMSVRPLVEPARLMVKKDEVESVKMLLKDIKLAITGINLGREEDIKDNE